MVLNATEVIERVYHFDGNLNTNAWDNDTVGTGAVDLSNGQRGASLAVAADADLAAIHFGDNLTFDIDELLYAEFMYEIAGFEANSNGYLGMATAYNADPDVIASSVWFKINGATRDLSIETDDGTTDNAIATGLTVTEDELQVARIDFASGVFTQSPPSLSLGGKSALQFTHTDADQVRVHMNSRLNTNVSMAAFSGALQPYCAALQDGSSATSAVVRVKQVKIGFRPIYS